MDQSCFFQTFRLCRRTSDAVHSLSHENRDDILVHLHQISNNHIFGNLRHIQVTSYRIFSLAVFIRYFYTR